MRNATRTRRATTNNGDKVLLRTVRVGDNEVVLVTKRANDKCLIVERMFCNVAPQGKSK